jgi:hypothetical protein
MTPEQFRSCALSQLEAVEGGHQGQVDFRVRKKIFATMDGAKNLGTLKLTPEDQALLIEAVGAAAFPANGSWGAKGWTKLTLSELPEDMAFWMHRAWAITAPATLVRRQENE